MRSLLQLFAFVVLMLCAQRASAFDWRDPVADGNRKGNELAAAGDCAGAREVYRQTLDKEPKSPELRYNIGLSLAQEDLREEAIENFKTVITSDKKLDSARHYNTGLCQYRDALAAKEGQDIQKAVELIESAVESNKEALRRDPSDLDAKHNLELALKVRDEFKQEQQQQQEQEQQDENQQGEDQQEKESGQEQQQKEREEEQKQEQSQKPQQSEQSEADQNKQQQAQPQEPTEGLTEEQARRILNQLQEEDSEAFEMLFRPVGAPRNRWEKDW